MTGPSVPAPLQVRARVLTSLVAGPVVLATAVAGGWWLTALILVVAALAAWEWSQLRALNPSPLLVACAVGGSLALPMAATLREPVAALALLLGLDFVALVVMRLTHTGEVKGDRLAAGAMVLVGGFLLGAALTPGIILRQVPDGLTWVLVIIIGTWACDTMAFAVGRRWGTRKVLPSISPQKTIEGTAAGLGSALAVGSAAAVFGSVPLLRLAGLGIVVGASAVGGDLLESALKRRMGVKDSGWIMPGHGGMLDRLDSLLLAVPSGYLYVLVTG